MMAKTAWVLGLCLAACFASRDARASWPQEFFEKPPAGTLVESHVQVPKPSVQAIAKKLGGQIKSLTNTKLRVHGRPIQVNVLTALDLANAQRLEASLLKLKKFPFCIRRDSVVIEFVGADVDDALARKTAFEMGAIAKPKRLAYRVVADLATIEQADYMAGNQLFQQFLNLQQKPGSTGGTEIARLVKGFQFGNRLILRNPALAGPKSKYSFEPAASEEKKLGPVHEFTFKQPMMRAGVPYVQVTMEVETNETGLAAEKKAPDKSLVEPTNAWPSGSAEIQSLAATIIGNKVKNKERANAILEWLTPGKNIRYSGQTGSRYGTMKVFQQKFGHCWDFSDCFVTLARAAGVPARQVAGWLYGSSGHVWAEFYDEGRGWQQVDPTGGGTLQVGIYHVPYFSTEDGSMPIVYLSMPKVDILE